MIFALDRGIIIEKQGRLTDFALARIKVKISELLDLDPWMYELEGD